MFTVLSAPCWGLPEDTSPQPLFSRGRPLLVTNVARGPFLLSLGDPGARDERGRWLPAVAGSLLARVTGSCFNLTFDTEVFLSYKAWRFHDFRFLLAAEKGQGARPSAWLGWWPERQFGHPGDRARNLGWKPRYLKNLTGCFAFSRAALIGQVPGASVCPRPWFPSPGWWWWGLWLLSTSPGWQGVRSCPDLAGGRGGGPSPGAGLQTLRVLCPGLHGGLVGITPIPAPHPQSTRRGQAAVRVGSGETHQAAEIGRAFV